ncbi:hypothetical protein ABBQ38_010727 [Trebouxia sp. C0009 RCD-2024]
MGSSESASQLLHYWIGQHSADFDPQASSSFEATVAHSIQELSTDPGTCSCKLLVTPRLQNNYGTMNGGCMAAVTCIIAGAALETLGARSGIVTSSTMDCLRAVPVGAIIEVIGKVSTVSNSSASVDVILQDCTSHKLIAKARYTEQAPHQIRARATAYLNNAATAARSAVQRLHTAAEHALQRADGASAAAQSDSDKGSDIRHKAMASLTAAGATVRAAAHRLQLAADSALRSSSADGDSGEARNRNPDDPQETSSPTSEIGAQAKTAALAVTTRVQAAAQSAANALSSRQPDPQDSEETEHRTDAQGSADSDPHDSPSSSSSANPQGSAAERAGHALRKRIGMVTEGFREDDCTCFDTTLGCTLKNISVGKGQCSAVLPTSARVSDPQGHLHAGCFCSLVDLISTTALASVMKQTAVSVSISVDFYAPVAIGEELEIEARVVKAGKTLTFAEIDFRQKSTGDLVAQGSHVEYSAGDDTYPDSTAEYHNRRVARQKSRL